MKFRIVRDYDEYQPEVLIDQGVSKPYWLNIGNYTCHTLEEAEKVCADYKRMSTNPIVREFEL